MPTIRAQGIRLQRLIAESRGLTHFEPIGRNARDRHRVSEPPCYAVLACYAVLGRPFSRFCLSSPMYSLRVFSP